MHGKRGCAAAGMPYTRQVNIVSLVARLHIEKCHAFELAGALAAACKFQHRRVTRLQGGSLAPRRAWHASFFVAEYISPSHIVCQTLSMSSMSVDSRRNFFSEMTWTRQALNSRDRKSVV